MIAFNTSVEFEEVTPVNMAPIDTNYEEKGIDTSPVPASPVDEKPHALHEETAHEAAERGHAATDR